MKRSVLSLIYISLVLILNGCAVAAIGAVGAAAGTTAVVATDPRSSGTLFDDNSIETKLRLKYNSYPNSNIYINSYNGIILLTGQVANIQLKKNAVFEAKVVPGVKNIYDYLDIRLPQSFAAKSTDSVTTTQIKTKLLTASGVDSNSIKVVTTNNVVYLMGMVTQAQAKMAADQAASVNGVSKVITLFEYIN